MPEILYMQDKDMENKIKNSDKKVYKVIFS